MCSIQQTLLAISLLFFAAVPGVWSIPDTRTFAILNPDAFEQAVTIESEFLRAGFKIHRRHSVTLDEAQGIAYFFDKSPFNPRDVPTWVEEFTGRAIGVYILQRRSAVAMLKAIVGPRDEDLYINKALPPWSLRAKYGSEGKRTFYVSSTIMMARRDIAYFFPDDAALTNDMNHMESSRGMLLHTEHPLMPFDVEYLGVSLDNITWLSSLEKDTTVKAKDVGDVIDSSGGNDEAPAVGNVRSSALHNDLEKNLKEDPLRLFSSTLGYLPNTGLDDDFLESLPEVMRNEVLRKRKEAELAYARAIGATADE